MICDNIQWNTDFSNFQGKRKLVREIMDKMNTRIKVFQ